jgi:hypothetical protein
VYLITGPTGNIGRGVVELLHKDGHDVRALIRDASRTSLLPDGIDITVGNLDDAGSVAAALRGIDSVFLLHAGPGTTQTQIMIDAARSAGVHRIVLLSSIGARLRAPAHHRRNTRRTRRPAPRIRTRRHLPAANGLMSNALSWADGIRDKNRCGSGNRWCGGRPDGRARCRGLAGRLAAAIAARWPGRGGAWCGGSASSGASFLVGTCRWR